MIEISVIIATYKRCESLKDTLDSLLVQEGIKNLDYEILVVDNNSPDKTKEVVESYVSKFKGKLKYLFEPKQGKSYSLNRGIKESKGEIIACTDDDVIADQKWFQYILKCNQEYNFVAMGGRVLPLYQNNTPAWIKENKDLLRGPILYHDYGAGIKIYVDKIMGPFVGANMILKKSCFEKYGLFKINLGVGKGKLGEDSDFFRRLKKNGEKIYYCGEALVWHKVDNKRTNFKYIAKWSLELGKYYTDDIRDESQENLVYYFGVPRYLFRKILEEAMLLIFNIFNRNNFLKHWIAFFSSLGMLVEYKWSSRTPETQ